MYLPLKSLPNAVSISHEDYLKTIVGVESKGKGVSALITALTVSHSEKL
jgi:hypothetical protein